MLLQDIYNILIDVKQNVSELDAKKENEHTTLLTQLFKEENPQKNFNEILDEFNKYLEELVTDENDLFRFKNCESEIM